MVSGFSFKLQGKIKPVTVGIVEITKGGGVSNLLMQQGAKCASRCNSIAHLPHGNPVYDVQLKMLDRTASARVGVANVDAYVDNLKHNTLKKGCGI